MRVFVAGASGAIGIRLVPQLIVPGYEVIGTLKSPGNAEHYGRAARNRSCSICSMHALCARVCSRVDPKAR